MFLYLFNKYFIPTWRFQIFTEFVIDCSIVKLIYIISQKRGGVNDKCAYLTNEL
jgi:hypothetical protein